MPANCPAGWSELSPVLRVTVLVRTSTDLICLMSMLSVPSPMAIHFLSVLPLASVPVRPSIDDRCRVVLPLAAGAVRVAEDSW